MRNVAVCVAKRWYMDNMQSISSEIYLLGLSLRLVMKYNLFVLHSLLIKLYIKLISGPFQAVERSECLNLDFQTDLKKERVFLKRVLF